MTSDQPRAVRATPPEANDNDSGPQDTESPSRPAATVTLADGTHETDQSPVAAVIDDGDGCESGPTTPAARPFAGTGSTEAGTCHYSAALSNLNLGSPIAAIHSGSQDRLAVEFSILMENDAHLIGLHASRKLLMCINHRSSKHHARQMVSVVVKLEPVSPIPSD